MIDLRSRAAWNDFEHIAVGEQRVATVGTPVHLQLFFILLLLIKTLLAARSESPHSAALHWVVPN